MNCVWTWDEQPCQKSARNRFSALCLKHLAELDALWDNFRRSQSVAQTAIDHRGMDKMLGNVDQFPELAAIVGAIFSKVRHFDLPDGLRCQTKVMASGHCIGVDHSGTRYVEQNRNKSSAEAQRARAGARIVWVIRTHDAQGRSLEPNQWIGKIEDGIVRMR